MAYCVTADIQIHAPQITDTIAASLNVAGAIAQADGLIDSHLRAIFEVPFASPDQLIENISSKIAASILLRSHYSKVRSSEPSAHATALMEEAMASLREIIANPALLSQELRSQTAEQADKSQISTAGGGGRQYFDMGDPEGWRP